MSKSGTESLQLQIPQDLKRKLAMDAARDGVTIRSLILRALVGAGYEIPDEEIRDKRKGQQ